MRWPFAVSFVAHAAALVVLYCRCSRAPEPTEAPICFEVHIADVAESPEIPEALTVESVADPVEPEIPIEEAPEPTEEEPIDFAEFAADDPPPAPPSFPLRMTRITPLRRATPSAPPSPAPPAARVTSAAPRGGCCAPPAYPKAARRLKQEGRVVLRVRVGADGAALSVEVEESSGHALLDEAAVAAVRGWTFEPAREGDERVECVLLVPFKFRLRVAD